MVFISCLSMMSPVGYTPQSTSAALRAGISQFNEIVYREKNGDNIIGAMVPAIPVEFRGQQRLSALFNLVLQDFPPDFTDQMHYDRLPTILCVPERERPGPRFKDIFANLVLKNGKRFQTFQSEIIEGGAISVFQAIHRTRQMLEDPRIPACLILAIDSFIDGRVLAWLDQTQRLKTSIQTDGVIPGEAACLSIVSNRPITKTSINLLGLGLAHETATILNEKPFLGKGLASALRLALSEAGIGMHDVDFRLCDVAGESYAFEEIVLALTRVMRQVRKCQPLWHPADCLGDCGAAMGLIQLAWAEQAFARGYAPGNIAALHGSSAFGGRAAAIVKKSEGDT